MGSNLNNSFLERNALYLALSENRTEEDILKSIVENGLYCGVIEIGGIAVALQHNGKLDNSILSAAINTGVIQKDSRKIHALVHEN
jgi:hypothetical protein